MSPSLPSRPGAAANRNGSSRPAAAASQHLMDAQAQDRRALSKDPFDTPPFPIPLSTLPMEARSAQELPSGDRWQFEPKWDGFRCLAFKSGDRVELRAKSGKPLTRFFPEIVASVREIGAPQCVIDGELAIEIGGRASFDALQMRLHPAESRVRKLSAETPAQFIAFDILASSDGRPLLQHPFEQRRALLEKFFEQSLRGESILLSPYTRDRTAAERWLHGRMERIDGVVAKALDEPYHPGERAMIKVKRLRTADCVVGGFRYERDGRLVGSLLLGLYNEHGKLDHVGFTSSIAHDDKASLTQRLEALREAPGFSGKAPGGPSRWSDERSAQWEPLRPIVVVEVRFDQVTGERFRHGTKFMRWRPDKAPTQCTFEQLRQSVAGG